MEISEAKTAMKSSYSTKMEVKNVNHGVGITEDDIWCLPGGDEFSIDEFFNLPNEEQDGKLIYGDEDEDAEEEEEGDDEEEEKDSNSSGSGFLSFSSLDPVKDSGHFSTHLAIPDVDMQELELWSHLMDDSVPEATLACLKPIMEAHHKKIGYSYLNRVESYTKQGIARVSVLPTAVPVKPRSKRSRTIVNRTWFTGSPPKTESSSSSSPSSPVSTLLFAPPAHPMGMRFTYGLPIPSTKKPKKKPSSLVNGETRLNPSVQRRCTHCQVTKTPQWRAGPSGPKTLCNACGVRFKSGRLFPEYRPACSPTFSSKVHSNSHRKVLEMRRKKETTEQFNGLV